MNNGTGDSKAPYDRLVHLRTKRKITPLLSKKLMSPMEDEDPNSQTAANGNGNEYLKQSKLQNNTSGKLSFRTNV